jgi:hypothetical protein
MIRFVVVLTMCVFFPSLSLYSAQPAPIQAGDVSQRDDIAKLEAGMMSAAAEKGAAGYLSYYADDAVELPNGAPRHGVLKR